MWQQRFLLALVQSVCAPGGKDVFKGQTERQTHPASQHDIQPMTDVTFGELTLLRAPNFNLNRILTALILTRILTLRIRVRVILKLTHSALTMICIQ